MSLAGWLTLADWGHAVALGMNEPLSLCLTV